MTDHRPARAAARYGAVVALAGALVAPGAALTAPTAFADSKLPIGVASDPAATPSATPNAEQSKTADPSATADPTPAPSEDSKTCAPADGSFTPRLTIENPKAVQGGKLHLTGDGWCNPEDKKASVIGLKIDDGKVSRNDATAVHDNRTIWAIVTPDENGHIDAWIDLPTRENAAFKNDEDAAKYASGEHTLRLLTGSLRDGDRSGTYGGTNSQGGVNTTFTIGEYAPGEAPEAIHATALTDGKGVQVRRDGSTVTVTVPGAEPGTWVYAATYLGDSPQALYASGWKRLDDNRSFSYETSETMPSATYRVVVHNGNQGAKNAVLGFADMTVERAAAPREDASDGDLGSYEAEPTLATVVTPAETVVNRVQAKAKEKAPQSTAAKPEAKTTAKATSSPSASPRSTASASASPTALTAQGPTVEGTELTGATKWFVNNANNLLLSAAGLVILALALTSRRTNK